MLFVRNVFLCNLTSLPDWNNGKWHDQAIQKGRNTNNQEEYAKCSSSLVITGMKIKTIVITFETSGNKGKMIIPRVGIDMRSALLGEL